MWVISLQPPHHPSMLLIIHGIAEHPSTLLFIRLQLIQGTPASLTSESSERWVSSKGWFLDAVGLRVISSCRRFLGSQPNWVIFNSQHALALIRANLLRLNLVKEVQVEALLRTLFSTCHVLTVGCVTWIRRGILAMSTEVTNTLPGAAISPTEVPGKSYVSTPLCHWKSSKSMGTASMSTLRGWFISSGLATHGPI